MNAFRPLLALALLSAAFTARANLIDFDSATGNVGNRYLLSDGVSFVGALSFATGGAPTAPNALYHDDATITVNSPVNVLTTSVGIAYRSTSGQTGGVPTLSVFTGLNGTGTALATLTLPDTATFATVTLPFAGSGRSFVLTDSSYSRIVYDNLAFTSQPVPEPSALAALGLGAAILLRRRRPYSA